MLCCRRRRPPQEQVEQDKIRQTRRKFKSITSTEPVCVTNEKNENLKKESCSNDKRTCARTIREEAEKEKETSNEKLAATRGNARLMK